MQYQILNGVMARKVGGSVILFQPETERLMTLNESGTRVWELLAEGAETGQMLARLATEFEGPEPLIQQQVLQFLSQLENERIITREG